nr:hypothetical protein [Lachnospiraceae bacterium]
EEINEGMPDKEFAEHNRFLCWSSSRRTMKVIRSLGKDGDIQSGDVTLYAIYTAKYPTPRVEETEDVKLNTFKAKQEYIPNLLDSDDYAVINIEGKCAGADQATAQLVLPDAVKDYYELCEVDQRKEKLGNGYAAVGIRLTDKVDADTARLISKKTDLRKFSIKIQSTAHETDEEGNPVFETIPVLLKADFKLPSYKLTSKTATIYNNFLPKGSEGDAVQAVFTLRERNGALDTEVYGGSWVADYVVKDGNAYKPVDEKDVSVKIAGGTNVITVSAAKAMKGFIRLRNTSWIQGAYVYAAFDIKESKSAPKATFDIKNVQLGNDKNDSITVKVLYSGGMIPDASKTTVDKSQLPAGIDAVYDGSDGTITVTGAKDVKAGTYKIGVSCEGCKKPAMLSVKVKSVDTEKCVKFTVKGKLDAIMGGSVYLKPRIKGISGGISSVKINPGNVSSQAGMDVNWDGSFIELYSNEDFVPGTEKRTYDLLLTLTTGREVPAKVTLTPAVGKVRLNVYDVRIKYPEDKAEGPDGAADPEIDEPVIVQAPVIAAYTYKYFTSPTTRVSKKYTVDLTTTAGRSILLLDENSVDVGKTGMCTAKYNNGVITITAAKDKPVKETVIKSKISGKWAAINKKSDASFNIRIVP